MRNAVATEQSSPKTVSASAVTPTRRSRSPSGPRPARRRAPASVEHAAYSFGGRGARRTPSVLASASTRYHGSRPDSGVAAPASRLRSAPGRPEALPRSATTQPHRGPQGGLGEDVPDREDPQRRPRRPRRRRQDLARRGPAVRRRRDPPPGPGRGRHHGVRLRPRGAAPRDLGVARARAVRARRAQGQPARRARATPTSSATSPPRCRPPTSRCSSSPRSRASRCRPRSRGSSPKQRGIPRAIFVNKLDRERASFYAHARPAQGAVRRRRRAAATPDRRGGRAPRRRRAAQRRRGHLHRRHRRRAPKARSRPRWRPRSTRCTTRSIEGIVVGDDDLMERYLGDEKIEIAELAEALAARRRRAAPCSRCCAAARRSSSASTGSRTFLVEEAPAPTRRATAPPPRSCSRRSSTPTSGT